MNCRECEALLVEAAREREGMEGRSRSLGTGVSAALEHAATCPWCAERLAEERALEAELRSLAAAESSREPSSGSEATLLAAYRSERGRERQTRRWMFAVSTAMAASLLVLVGAAVLLSSESSKLVHSMTSRVVAPAVRPVPDGRAASPSSLAVAAGQTSDEGDWAAESVAGQQQEEVTDFVAFYPGADLGAMDSVALVRVRMPSSALGSFGLPVAQGSEEQWVSADLLIGEDGSPQAIRFVRAVSRGSRN